MEIGAAVYRALHSGLGAVSLKCVVFLISTTKPLFGIGTFAHTECPFPLGHHRGSRQVPNYWTVEAKGHLHPLKWTRGLIFAWAPWDRTRLRARAETGVAVGSILSKNGRPRKAGSFSWGSKSCRRHKSRVSHRQVLAMSCH